MDRSLGRPVSNKLQGMGASVRFHDDLLDGDAADDEGIALAAAQGWVYLTADHGPGKHKGPLLQAVHTCEAKCFILFKANHLSAANKAALVQSHLDFIGRMAKKRDGPFAYRLHRNRRPENVHPLP